ncbi:ABC transporter ATP-binding protein [Streptomyces sp. NPDC085932]|uniref:ABC transporter ATP-binding protein n=1 Tax=Streptomyces sp. NPDC085932 TaxID=3365741 RepID=UPI0037D3A800
MNILELDRLQVCYGEFRALSDVTLTVAEGETLAVLGANGAGKSTLLRTLAGLLQPNEGHVRYCGEDLAGVPAHKRVGRGIALVPEGRRLFGSLTVEDNLRVGGVRTRQGPWTLRTVCDLLPLLAELKKRPASSLSGGEQQAVAIGRALMSNPRLLLLDEVSLGLAPVVVKGLYAALPDITAAGTTVLVVEQNMVQAMAVADRVHCLLEGRTSLVGHVKDVTPEQVAQAYFGTTQEEAS